MNTTITISAVSFVAICQLVVMVLAIAGVVIAAQILAHSKNDTVQLRRKHAIAMENSVYISTSVVLVTYIILVSATRIFRGAGNVMGAILIAIGVAVVGITYIVSYLLAIYIWNKAHNARVLQNTKVRKLEKEKRYHENCSNAFKLMLRISDTVNK